VISSLWINEKQILYQLPLLLATAAGTAQPVDQAPRFIQQRLWRVVASATIPGNVFGSNYDLGGQGIGYNDNQGANRGIYRPDGVDIKASSDTAAPGTGYVLGWRALGEWTNYTVNVAQAGQ
jgi:hypothetical protein